MCKKNDFIIFCFNKLFHCYDYSEDYSYEYSEDYSYEYSGDYSDDYSGDYSYMYSDDNVFNTTAMSSGYKTAIIIDDQKLTNAAEETA